MRSMPRAALSIVLFLAGGVAFAQFSRDLRLVQPRMNGDDVKVAQQRLLLWGFSGVGEADGWFGPKSEAAVRKFQEYLGYVPDGVVNRAVFDSLSSKDDLSALLMRDVKSAESMNLKAFKIVEDDVEDRSAEGGLRKRYYENGQLRFVEIGIFGEMGKVEYLVSKVGDRSLIRTKLYSYPAPFDGEHASIEHLMYYVTGKASYAIKDGRFADAGKALPQIADLIAK